MAVGKKVRSLLRFILKLAALLLGGVARGLGLAILLVLGLSATAYFTLGRMFDEDNVRSILVAQMQDLFHRPVQIKRVVLTLHGIKALEVKVLANPGAQGGPLLESEFALITVKPLPLLARRVEFGEVKLVSPRIHILRDEAGEWNVSDLLVSTRAASPGRKEGPFELPFALAADRTVIESGRLRISDRYRGRDFDIEKFNLDIDELDVARPFAYSVSFDNANRFGRTEVATSWRLDGSLSLASFDWSQASMSVDRLRVAVDGMLIEGAAVLKGFPKTAVELDLKVPALGDAQLARYLPEPPGFSLPPSRWRAAVARSEPGKFRVERLGLDAPPLAASASGLVDLTGAEPSVAAEVVLDDFPLASAGVLVPRWSRHKLKGTARGQLSFSGWRQKLTLHKGRAAVRALSGVFKDFSVSGANADFAATSDFSKVTVGVSHADVSAFSNSFSDLALSLTLANRDLKVEDLALKWNGSKLRLKARVRNLADPKQVILSGNLDRLRWEDAQRLVEDLAARASTQASAGTAPPSNLWVRTFKYAIPKKFPDTLGHITVDRITQQYVDCGNLDIVWDIRGVSPTLKRVSGELKVGFGPGRVTDIPALQKSHNLLRIIFIPFVYMHKMNNLSVLSAAEAYPRSIDFARIEGEYGLKSGVATTRYFYVDSPQLVVYSDGTFDFGRESVDMNILTRLTKHRSGLPEWWVDELGRPAIAFQVKGDMNEPDLEPRLRKMKADEIEQKKDDAMRRAKAGFTEAEKLREL